MLPTKLTQPTVGEYVIIILFYSVRMIFEGDGRLISSIRRTKIIIDNQPNEAELENIHALRTERLCLPAAAFSVVPLSVDCVRGVLFFVVLL